jgi:hypothetical protein
MIEQGMGRGVPGSVFIGDGNLNSAVPANTDYYFRMYINVWDVIVNDYVGHPCNSSLFSPLLGFWGIVEARTSPSLQYRPRLIRAYTLNGGSEGPDLPPRGLSDVSQRVGGFWWPGYYPVGASRSCNCNVWLDQQHWYLFEWWVHYLDVAQQRYFFGSLDIYDAENNYAHVADLSDYDHEVQPGIVRTLEQARLDGAFVYKGYLTSADPLNIDVYPWVGGVNPWQIMIGCEGNAAQQLVSPYERYLYSAPAVATGGFPARLPAL